MAAALAVLTLALALYFAPRGFHFGFVDMGHDGYQLQQALDLSRGGVIFRDTFDQYGPLNGYINTVGFLAFGRTLLAIKYFVCVWYALTAIALYILARRWLNPWLSAFTILLWLALAPFYGHGIMISAHVYTLLMQAVATILVVRTTDLSPRRYALVGLIAGVCWAVKQSTGVLYLIAIMAYLSLWLYSAPASWRKVADATVALGATFLGVVAVALAWLWTQGALHDWYLQTVVFPREFYLMSPSVSTGFWPADIADRVRGGFVAFAQLQRTESALWIIVRAVVFAGAVVAVARGRPTADIVLMALITATLWPGAYPSANFMHQWWTSSLALASFVVCVRAVFGRVVRAPLVSVATAVSITILSSVDIAQRLEQAHGRAWGLNQTLTEPPLLRGIKTDLATRTVFDTFWTVMTQYRAAHPDTRIVAIEAADGWNGGIADSLPFLAFFDNNRHTQPVYWRLPILSTRIYPRYGEQFWKEVAAERPLHRRSQPRTIQAAARCRIPGARGRTERQWALVRPRARLRRGHEGGNLSRERRYRHTGIFERTRPGAGLSHGPQPVRRLSRSARAAVG